MLQSDRTARHDSGSLLASIQSGEEAAAASREAALKGMEEMAEKYRDVGDLYVKAGDA